MKQEAYESYVADNLRIIGENTARLGGSYMQKRWIELIRPAPSEIRTADEIITGMKDRLNKLGGKK